MGRLLAEHCKPAGQVLWLMQVADAGAPRGHCCMAEPVVSKAE
jgi:hypothetical protein